MKDEPFFQNWAKNQELKASDEFIERDSEAEAIDSKTLIRLDCQADAQHQGMS